MDQSVRGHNCASSTVMVTPTACTAILEDLFQDGKRSLLYEGAIPGILEKNINSKRIRS